MNSRVAFLLTTFNGFLTIFLIGYNPIYAGWWYVAKFLVAMAYRFTDWKKKNFHYFMTEFCYFANLCLVVYYIMVRYGYFEMDPELGDWFFRMVFCMSNGPLALAAFTLGDKLVFHDIQYSISLIIHLSPALLTWSFRWNCDDFISADDEASFTLANIWEDGLDNFRTAIPVYGAWFIWYILVVMIFLRKRIAEKGNTTMYSYLTAGRPNHPINWILKYVPNQFLKQICYMLIHMATIIPTMILTGFWWNSFYAHTAFIIVMCLSVIWHASSYYDYKLIRKENTDRTAQKAKKIKKLLQGQKSEISETNTDPPESDGSKQKNE